MNSTIGEITNPRQLIRVIAKKHDIKMVVLIGKSRRREVVDIRSALVKSLRNDWHMTYSAIGRLMNRDHATAMNLYSRKQKKIIEFVVPKNAVAKVKKLQSV